MTRRESPMNGMTTDPEARAEEVTREHALRERGRVYDTCCCGWYGSGHPVHVAAALAEAGLLVDPSRDDPYWVASRQMWKEKADAARAELAEVKRARDASERAHAAASHRADDAERRGAVDALREAADAVGSDGDWLRARADRLTEGGAS